MKKTLSKTEAKEVIETFFKRQSFSQEEVRKVKRIAMKHKIRLGEKRKLFCKICLAQLKGKTRVTRTSKTIECESCGYKNKFRI